MVDYGEPGNDHKTLGHMVLSTVPRAELVGSAGPHPALVANSL